MDLSSVVNSFAVTYGISVTRRGVPVFSDGVLTSIGSSQTLVVDPAIVYPLSGRETMLLPEGQRTREPVSVLSVVALRGVQDPGGASADRFAWQGNTYEVQSVERWAENANFYRSVAIKVPVS